MDAYKQKIILTDQIHEKKNRHIFKIESFITGSKNLVQIIIPVLRLLETKRSH